MIEPDGTTHVGERGVLHVMEGLGWRGTSAALGSAALHPMAALGYRLFANNRRFFARFVFWSPHPDAKDF